MAGRGFTGLVLLAACAFATIWRPLDAHAQLALPGAVAPTPEGAIASPSAKPKPKKKPRAANAGGGESTDGFKGPALAPKPPSEETIVGKPLMLDGGRGSITFERAGADLRVAKFSIHGDRLSRSGESCEVNVGASMATTPHEDESGLRGYRLDFPACPVAFEVLDGAVLVSNGGKPCEFKAADCRANPAGVWGIGAAELDPKKAKEMLGNRAKVEKTVRADFRKLYDRYKSDVPLRKLLVHEQAEFPSARETTCRNYAQESDFGYCALRVTEGRALTLAYQLAKGVKRPADLETNEAYLAARAKALKHRH